MFPQEAGIRTPSEFFYEARHIPYANNLWCVYSSEVLGMEVWDLEKVFNCLLLWKLSRIFGLYAHRYQCSFASYHNTWYVSSKTTKKSTHMTVLIWPRKSFFTPEKAWLFQEPFLTHLWIYYVHHKIDVIK